MPDKTTRLLVIRHGETDWNIATRIQGHTDIPLNARGRWQAERLGEALADEGIHAIYSSDLQRARATADAIATRAGLTLRIDPALRERHFGRFEGRTQDEVGVHWPEELLRWRERDPSYGPEGGEVLQAFYERCVGAATRLAAQHPGETIALVAHGGVLDCFYRAANRVPVEAPRSWKVANASINRLLYSPEGFTMVGWADDLHLAHAPAALDEHSDGARTGSGENPFRAI
ncbi:histidine phosphatase family protein [Aquabacterium sp.]|uniref:histidine phosphatase family protein n=1 Tax=Aquabacterium sp. TaxID=1872578 RepID=UPI0025B7D05C|nr:histidine phosphatase family protein [Aquabacterium sp.]